ncbi:unnamed protein product [Notodromas monacha]|uniref:C2H2-type domain-containing protein n=1 Tax=Notodromas monacha TaxID=399045 RepID=A0A7R9GFJ6_9CRUS|nr:unnamed protein product [Notodromas monacha]CAG0918940.1 unnamed protein product [Notodromas monacha]
MEVDDENSNSGSPDSKPPSSYLNVSDGISIVEEIIGADGSWFLADGVSPETAYLTSRTTALSTSPSGIGDSASPRKSGSRKSSTSLNSGVRGRLMTKTLNYWTGPPVVYEKLERSRQSARECRARKKLRYQYLEELVTSREKAINSLRQELDVYRKVAKEIDEGRIPDGVMELIKGNVKTEDPMKGMGTIKLGKGSDCSGNASFEIRHTFSWSILNRDIFEHAMILILFVGSSVLKMSARDLHCFVCSDYEEGGSDEYAFIPIFGQATECTSTELVEKLGSILGIVMPCDGDIVPSLCVRCYNLINDIDGLEVKLREDIYDLRMLYQNGVDARRLGVKIKRDNETFWGDIREENGQSFMPISGLDGAALDQLTLRSAERVETSAEKQSKSDDVEDSPSVPCDAKDTIIEHVKVEHEDVRARDTFEAEIDDSEPSTSSRKPQLASMEHSVKKKLVLGGSTQSSRFPSSQDEDMSMLPAWSGDDFSDEEDDDEDDMEETVMIENPRRFRRDDEPDEGSSGGGGGGGKDDSVHDAQDVPSRDGGSSKDANDRNPSGSSSSVTKTAPLAVRTEGIFNSRMPSHMIAPGRLKTLIVREDVKVASIQHNLRHATSTRYAYACNICNKKLKKRDAMEEHLRIHKVAAKVPFQLEKLDENEENSNPDHFTDLDGSMETSDVISVGNMQRILSQLCDVSGIGDNTQLFFNEPRSVLNTSNRGGLCDLCGMNTPNLYLHKRTVHPDVTMFRCSCCQNVFADERRYLEHVTKESRLGAGRKYVCPEEGCGEIFSRLGPWRSHIRNVHSDSRSACSKCGKVFYSSYAMVHEMKCIGRVEDYASPDDYHRRRITKRKRTNAFNPELFGLDKNENDLQFCPKCCRKVKNRYWLVVHMDKVHAPRPYQCGQCGKGFQRQDQLDIHIVCHTDKVAFRCEVCGKNLANPSSLKKHLSLHEGRQTKPHECDVCGKRFSGRDNLNVHVRGVHSTSDDLRYICDVCGKKFPILGWLKNHLRSHTNNRPYTCTHCKKSFKEPNKLRAHERLHTGEKPYVCSVCREGFIRAEGLKKHMLRVHQVDSSKMSYLLIEDTTQVFGSSSSSSSSKQGKLDEGEASAQPASPLIE